MKGRTLRFSDAHPFPAEQKPPAELFDNMCEAAIA